MAGHLEALLEEEEGSGDDSDGGSSDSSVLDDYVTQPLLLLAGRVVQGAHSGRARRRAVRVAGYLLSAAFLAMAAVAAWTVWTVTTDEEGVDRWLWNVALVCALASVPLSLYDIHHHVSHYVRPRLQMHYVRILWLVPVYAIQSCLALRFPEARVFIETPRDAYEAYAILSFYSLMLEALGPRDILIQQLEEQGGDAALPAPCCCVRWARGEPLLTNTSMGVLQYVVVRLVTTVTALVAESAGVYGDGVWSLRSAYTYCTLALNVSQLYALFMLAFFYLHFRGELAAARIKPLGKFTTIKALVFFTYWQSVLISILLSTGALGGAGSWSAADTGASLNNLLICIEVVGFAWAHHTYFSFADFQADHDAGLARKRSVMHALRHMLPTDVLVNATALLRAAVARCWGAGASADGAAAPRAPSSRTANGSAHSFATASSVELLSDCDRNLDDEEGDAICQDTGPAAAAAYAQTVAYGEDLGLSIGGQAAVSFLGLP